MLFADAEYSNNLWVFVLKVKGLTVFLLKQVLTYFYRAWPGSPFYKGGRGDLILLCIGALHRTSSFN
jgi:hypothetical protein